ncbi:MAG: cysteine synthase family protein [Chloroflexi bacterium]|nr:cysteine synthase family protein [Chloroflexota bacterium]
MSSRLPWDRDRSRRAIPSGRGEVIPFTGPRPEEPLLQRIGNTPLLPIRRIALEVPGVTILAKAEWFNPGGSVKDRPALRMILEGERSGALTPDKIILDSTSGNTGIAYAMIAAVKGYRVSLVVPENISEERKKILRAYGAELVFSDPLEGSDGAILTVRQLYKEHPALYFWPDQYNNPANWLSHYDTTGHEIWYQSDYAVTHFVAGIGTSGTLMGTGKRLKEYNPDIQIVGVEPADELQVIEGLKYLATAIVPGIYDESILDRHVFVTPESAYTMTRRLAQEEGLFVGFSAGAAMHAALELAREIQYGVIATVFPDSGDKYLSLRKWE